MGTRDAGWIPGFGKIPWSRKWQSTGKSHGQSSLAGYSPWGCKESDMTEHTHTYIHMLHIMHSIDTYEQIQNVFIKLLIVAFPMKPKQNKNVY